MAGERESSMCEPDRNIPVAERESKLPCTCMLMPSRVFFPGHCFDMRGEEAASLNASCF